MYREGGLKYWSLQGRRIRYMGVYSEGVFKYGTNIGKED